jgi:hypothetical protein
LCIKLVIKLYYDARSTNHQKKKKIINIVVFMLAVAFCTKFSPVSVQVPTFTRLALLILAGGERFKSRLEHGQIWLRVFIGFRSTSKNIVEKQLR